MSLLVEQQLISCAGVNSALKVNAAGRVRLRQRRRVATLSAARGCVWWGPRTQTEDGAWQARHVVGVTVVKQCCRESLVGNSNVSPSQRLSCGWVPTSLSCGENSEVSVRCGEQRILKVYCLTLPSGRRQALGKAECNRWCGQRCAAIVIATTVVKLGPPLQ